MDINLTQLFLAIVGVIMGYLLWLIKRYQIKVDELDNRVTKVETIMDLLGDIRSDLSAMKTDIEVIKTKLNYRRSTDQQP